MALLERTSVEPVEPLRSIDDIPPGSRYVPERPLTVDEFYDLIDEDSHAELDEGAIIMPSPAGYRHEDCFGFLHFLLRGFVEAKGLGVLLGAHTKVRLGLRTAREPDLLFVSQARRSIVRELDIDGGPDLVVEIINSSKGRSEALAKVPQYARAQVRELWLIDLPRRRLSQMLLAGVEYEETVLEGEAELQAVTVTGFHLPVSALFSEEGHPPAWPILQELLKSED